ncbi:hypothetical protein CLV92_10131 [Kineococcus xinjiangensis]|uniref:Uncharacterized protein n=1 Tax=Kineococcus xinjiangensis TaxID=512762 RepID=A0A2S6IVM8_9ACTN|nr:hypothetical protein [Kineococcus xinjiangensis]PPK98336.1 hypothetical protein CLV92_10131 [Kineococcus xinjiangensis]
MSLRPDREDLTLQRDALAAARRNWGEALAALEGECCAPAQAAVREEARALRRALASRAKTPPPADGDALRGAVSALHRVAAQPDPFDEAWRACQDAERVVDLAALDLATAAGHDA